MTPPDSSKTGAPIAAPDSSPASTPSSALPDGWHRTGYDTIGNADGYRVSKQHVTNFVGTHPYYGAHTPWGGFLGAFPELPDATQACSNMAATCAAARA